MRFDDIQPLDEAPKKPRNKSDSGAAAFGQMGNTLSGANKSKSSTGGTTTQTPTGLIHTAKPQQQVQQPQQPQAQQPQPQAQQPQPSAPKNNNAAASPTQQPQPQQAQSAPANAAPADTTKITKAWIQYLKNNQIVALQSDPKTGQLAYKKKPTVDNLSRFLQSETNYDEKMINDVIQSVIGKKRTGGKVPGQVSQTPGAIKKREARAAQKQPPTDIPVNEAIIDRQIEISEKDVEAVFSALLSQAPAGVTSQSAPNNQSPQNNAAQKSQDIEKLKKLIKDGMSARQRKELWTSLTDSSLYESSVDRSEARQILKHASQMRGNIRIEDLQAAWSKAGYPTDLDELGKILNKAGFGRADIRDIFDEVIGDDGSEDSEEETAPSPTIIKIVDYINKTGIKDEILSFMEQEFGQELNQEAPKQSGWLDKAKNFGKKMFAREATMEEVHQIFKKVLLKERVELPMRIKEQEQQLLGRSRK